MDDSTIAAIATPVGRGGIGIVRISGPQSIPIAARVFTKDPADKNRTDTVFSNARAPLQSHHLYHGYVTDPQSELIIDEVLMTVMRGPRSYTCEDVVEFQSHAGPLILQQILTVVLEAGARLADPGEFTRRAFLNGRIDLTQAEAVMDMISARSAKALQVASNQMVGVLRREVMAIRQHLQHLQTEIEADIEFGETDGICFDAAQGITTLEVQVAQRLERLLSERCGGVCLAQRRAANKRDAAVAPLLGEPQVNWPRGAQRLIR